MYTYIHAYTRTQKKHARAHTHTRARVSMYACMHSGLGWLTVIRRDFSVRLTQICHGLLEYLKVKQK